MKHLILILIFSLSLLPDLSLGQQKTFHPTTVKQAVYFNITPPLRDMKLIPPVSKGTQYKEIPNKIGMKEFNHLTSNAFTLPEDPVWQKQDGSVIPLSRAPLQNFEGVGNLSGVDPPDTQGDISTGAYVQVVNMNFAVYSKTGTILFGPADLMTIWAGNPAPYTVGNGDPVVLYDQAADRWIISQFSLPSASQNAELVAISTTSDPTGSWYCYIFPFGNKMPDYPKFGIWPDGYYLSFNQFVNQSSWGGVGAVVLQRSQMLIGGATSYMYFDLGPSSDPSSMLPSDWDGSTPPLANEPNYFTYFNDWSSPTEDYLKIWQFHTDWVTPANSTFSEVYSLVTAPFKSQICADATGRGVCIPQPGTANKLESLSDRLMFRLQYRNFGDHQSMVTNHTVDVDNSGHAGIRWYELRNSGSGWGIYQQGTYAPDAYHRWVGSVAMNGSGAIALGYSVSGSTSVYPGIRYTGRRANDPLGVMTIAEQTIMDGGGSKTYPSRWGDYSMMSVDPSDDQAFWYTTEYIQSTGTWNWHTRVASFTINNAPSVATLSATAVTLSTATLNGTVNPNGQATNYHFEWGTTVGYGNSTSIISAGSGVITLSVNASVSSLIGGTPYHYRLVAVNGDGTTYGDDITFTPGAAVLSTTAPSTITTSTAISGGNITSNGGASVTARGVCWNTSANPVATDSHTSDGSGSGSFTSNITGLLANTSYHVRAYAINSAGTWYGDDLQFTTVCAIYSLPFYEGFASTFMPTCWTQVDHQGNGQIWQFGVITGETPNPVLTGNYAYLNSDAYGSGNTENADLISPLLDLSAFTTVNLQFNHYFRLYTGEIGTLSYSINNGTTWTTIQAFNATTPNPDVFSQSIPAVAGQSQVKFKWNYTGTWGWYWAIDDIQITGMLTNRELTNITIGSGTTSCYNAGQTITLAGNSTNFTVQNGGDVTLIAGQNILFMPGTMVQSGGHLWGYITISDTYCVNPSSPINAPLNPETQTIVNEAETTLFRVYPNPTTGKFTLEFNADPKDNQATVRIFGMLGEEVLHENLGVTGKTEFSLSGRSNGIYIIRVIMGDRTATTKIIKQ
ncbi:MAG: T9SS type A sorting domain-containing protein [Bacteroidales bacterium]|jgi:hypothetical protein|nr:T9SS type A sorting domain-containing protein [Bacteroidales bacterium]